MRKKMSLGNERKISSPLGKELAKRDKSLRILHLMIQ